jgi:hypothetical protein
MMNNVLFSGLLRAADPIDLRNGGRMVKFSVEYQEKYKDTLKTHRVEWSAFGKVGDMILEAPLDSRVMVAGHLEANPWTKDGVTRFFLNACADKIEVLQIPRGMALPAPAAPPPPPPPPPPEEKPLPRPELGGQQDFDYDSIPF